MILRLHLLLTLICLKFYDAKSITCTFAYRTADVWGYGCQLNNQTIEIESDVIRIDGNHATDMGDEHVLWIESYNSKISFFPNVLVKHFPNMVRAAFQKSQMKSFGSLINFGKLEYIGLDDNLLSDIPDSMFANCSRLITLDLNRNNVGNISEHTFSGLTNLIALNLMQNNISSIHPDAFSSVVNLREIDLNSNKLEAFDSNPFKNSTFLNIIRIDNNRISSLPDMFFVNNRQLIHLNLSSNQITSIGATIFGTANFVYGSVDLSNNLIEELPILEQNIYLKVLNLDNNKIKRILPGTFHGLTFLTHLKLANNQLQNLQPKTFTGLINMMYLYLNSNNIADIQPKAFDTFAFLYEIWLSDNKLKVLNASSFETTYSLRVLRVEGNQIERIDGDIFTVLPNLAILNLTGNVCSNESFFINWENRAKQIFPTFRTCGATSLVTLPIGLLSLVFILLLYYSKNVLYSRYTFSNGIA